MECSPALWKNLSHPAKPVRQATLQLLAALPEHVLAGPEKILQSPTPSSSRPPGTTKREGPGMYQDSFFYLAWQYKKLLTDWATLKNIFLGDAGSVML